MFGRRHLVPLAALLAAVPAVAQRAPMAPAVDTILAATPPMGWNSWNKFACNVNEELIRETADAMVSSGMKDAGYRYIVIDDCWQVARGPDGTIVPDSTRFPSGMKALADYVHSKGLKFGLYSDAGRKTCQGRPGGRGYEFQDARTYAAWGVDYLKYDWCYHGTQNAPASYALMRDALRASGRPIVFSLCEWGSNQPWIWAGDVGQLWRTTGDISDDWNSWTHILDLQVGLDRYAGPGHWNDPDMMEVGNGGMTPGEYRAHFSMWAMLAAPLIAGNDLRSMTPEIRDILTNREIIALDQDALGAEATRVRDDGDQEVWVKRLADGSRAVALLNRGTSDTTIAFSWSEIGFDATHAAPVRDLWLHKDVGPAAGQYAAVVPSHGVVVVRVGP